MLQGQSQGEGRWIVAPDIYPRQRHGSPSRGQGIVPNPVKIALPTKGLNPPPPKQVFIISFLNTGRKVWGTVPPCCV